MKRMDPEMFAVEALTVVRRLLERGDREQAERDARRLFGPNASPLIEALKHPPPLCGTCGEPAPWAVSGELCPTCTDRREKDKARIVAGAMAEAGVPYVR